MTSPSPNGPVALEFDPDKLVVGGDKDIRQQLSGIALDGSHMWLACDEGCRIERLTRNESAAKPAFRNHTIFALEDILTLPANPTKEETDVEGMYVDDGWLWIVGSHSVKRKKPKSDALDEVAKKLADVGRDGNRHLLARIPIVGGELRKQDGTRQAAALDMTDSSSALLDAIRSSADPHLLPFLEIPGKDNGLDIEGLAARGMRAWVGLRGPVLREWCAVLELHFEAEGSRLRLKPQTGGLLYRKHFMNLHSLGVRDLVLLGDDMLILTGPTMAHDAPSEIWRWKNGAREGATPAAADLQSIVQLPQGNRVDKPEGFTVFEQGAGGTSVLVVYHTPSDDRVSKPATVRGDLFRIP